MKQSRHTLSLGKVSRKVNVPLLDLLAAASTGKVLYHQQEEKAVFSLDDVLAWKETSLMEQNAQDARQRDNIVNILYRKIQEKGFLALSRVTVEAMVKESLFFSFPSTEERLHLAVENYCQRFYDPRLYLPVEYAASRYLHSLRNAGVQLKGKTNFSTIKQRFMQWIHQGKIQGKQYVDPFDGQEKYCVKHTQLQQIIDQCVQAQQEVRINHETRTRRYAAYTEILMMVRTFKKGVEDVSGVRLPDRLFLKKPTGTYASISYKKEEHDELATGT